MTQKNTPGPWSYGASAGNHDYLIYSETRQNALAYVRDFDEPNACLISAAPDLLSALIAVVEKFDATNESWRVDTDEICAARAAIRKATGE